MREDVELEKEKEETVIYEEGGKKKISSYI